MKSTYSKIIKIFAFAVITMLAIASILGSGGGGGGDIPPFTLENGIATDDLNGDGYIDLILATTYIAGPPPHPGNVYVYLQNHLSPGTFLSPQSYIIGNDPWNPLVADINGDDLPDIVVANINSNNISILFQDATHSGKFLAARNLYCGQSPYWAAIGLLNNDDRLDIVTANYDTGNSVSILFQDPNPVSTGEFLPALQLATGNPAESVAIGDLNNDGLMDIAVDGSSTVFIMMQKEQAPGEFLPPVSFAAGERPRCVAIHDLDGDGFNDMAIANAGSSDGGRNASVSVLIQDHDQPGSFQPATNYQTADGAQKVIAGDLNKDDKPDLAIGTVSYQSQNSGAVSILFQDPVFAGTFWPAANYYAGFTPYFIAVGDLNGDDMADIAVSEGPSILFQDSINDNAFLPLSIIGSFFDP